MRPTLYKPEYCELIIDEMREGASIEEVAAAIGVSKQTLYNWEKTHDEFLYAKKRGEELSKAWWMREGRINLKESKFNYTGWYMNMKNRFKWTDRVEQKSEVTITDPIEVNVRQAGIKFANDEKEVDTKRRD